MNQLYGDYQMCLKIIIDSVNAADQGRRSPLQLAAQRSQLDIARLLLSRGAWGDHTDARGWTTAFYLWSFSHVRMPTQTCFLKLMNMDGHCNLGSMACYNWTALHRAAAFGTAEDVELLIRYGTEPSICTEGLQWSALYYSTLFSNELTLRELTNSSYCLDINSSDVRGWTPLHVAAAQGVSAMLTLLLELGANPYQMTKSTSFHVPEALRERVLAPLDVAKESGPEQYNVYIKALCAAGFELDLSQVADDSGYSN